MKLFSYNSKHKVVVGVLVILWAAYSFTGKRKTSIFSDSGQVLQSGSIKNGKNNGKWIWYYSNGNKKMEGNFNMGSREGEWITYDKNGKKLSKSNYENDKLEGLSVTYTSKGAAASTTLYSNDEIVKKY